MSDKLFDKIKRIEPSELEIHGVIERAKKDANGYHTYVCPICGNGTGKDGDGLTIKRHADGVFNYHCWKCTGKTDFTAVDLIDVRIGAHGDMAKVAEWAKKNLGLKGDDFSLSQGKSTAAKSSTNAPNEEVKSENSSPSTVEKAAESASKNKVESEVNANSSEVEEIKKSAQICAKTDEELKKLYLNLNAATLKEYGVLDDGAQPHLITCPGCLKKWATWKRENNGYHSDCPSCGCQYNIFETISETYSFDEMTFDEALTKAKEILGDNPNGEKNFGDTPKEEKNFEKLIRASWLNLEKFVVECGGNFRALTFDTLKKFGIGYFAEFYRDKTPRLIIPTSFNHFLARLTVPVENFPADVREEVIPKQHFGHPDIFGLKNALNALKDNPTQIIFAVEGEIDAMSINQCGFIAISFCGSNVIDPMRAQLKKFPAGTKFILSFDGDETGRKKTPKALDAIKSSGYLATDLKLSNKYKDANEFLQADADGLKARLAEMISEAEKIFSMTEEDTKSDAEKLDGVISLANYLQTDFFSEIDAAAQYSDRKSGFKNLDERQVWLPGLYVLGGLPGLGKTAFAIQLLEQFAQRGETCLYCSLEMSRAEIMARIIARRNYQLDTEKKNPLSTTDIRRGIFNRDKLSLVYNQLCNDLKISIMELDDENISAIMAKLEKFCARVESPPIVVIDYLQMIRSDKDTAKMAVDEIVRALKNFQRKTNTTFVVISSFNRESYNEEVTFKSFKESGGIEYSADVVFGMQIDIGGQARTATTTEEGKKKNPRAVQLVCLKNRHGANYDVTFNYFPAVDTFEPAVLKMKVGDEEGIAYR